MDSCRNETRFQGIATHESFAWGSARIPGLAGTRPVFRGLRRQLLCLCYWCYWSYSCRNETRFQGIATPDTFPSTSLRVSSTLLQERDPFSGDCDRRYPRGWRPTPPDPLQERDPFSGDCDKRTCARAAHTEHPLSYNSLAGTRPVFRGWRCKAVSLGFGAPAEESLG